MGNVVQANNKKNTTSKGSKECKGITGSTLKIIAIIAMFIDHFAYVFIENMITNMQPNNFNSMTTEQIQEWTTANPIVMVLSFADLFLRGIGRFGFPIFAFLLIEGVVHTSNIKKYLRNLAIFALISEIPFDLAFHGELFYWGYQNVFFTLGIGVAVLMFIRYMEEMKPKKVASYQLFLASVCGGIGIGILFVNCFLGMMFGMRIISIGFVVISVLSMLGVFAFLKKKEKAWKIDRQYVVSNAIPVIVLGLIVAELLKTDYSAWGVFTIVVMYVYHKQHVKSMRNGCISLAIMSPMELPAFFMLPLVKKYNGKRGIQMKYFFYAFYPVHLLVLYLLALALGIVG